MLTRLGELTRPLMKPEKPLFFFKAAFLESLVSSEYLLELTDVSTIRGSDLSKPLSPVEKL
jgi:hypothetical protein